MMKISPDRTRKATLKMRGLAASIWRFSDECSRVRGNLAPGATLAMDQIDPVINALDDALVTIRTLDLEVFKASDPQAYSAVCNSLSTGNVVRALTAPRNNAVHSADVVDPDLPRAIGPLEHDRFIIFPRWKSRSEMPAEMFQYSQGKKKGQDQTAYVASYDAGAAGRLVLDTLLDAFAFFDRCDPDIANRDAEGHLVGFPLPPLPVAGYLRLSPEWPDHEAVHRRIRDTTRTVQPAGVGREITGRLDTDDGPVFCGYTTVDSGHRWSFTEDTGQVLRDVRHGYPYAVATDGSAVCIEIRGCDLMAGTTKLIEVDLPNWTADAFLPWTSWWELCSNDASYYRQQRQPT